MNVRFTRMPGADIIIMMHVSRKGGLFLRSFRFEGTRKLMNALLLTPLFDSFEVMNAYVRSYAVFSIECPGRADTGEVSPPPLWKQIRPVMTDILKGTKKPQQIKLVLKLSEKYTGAVLRRSGSSIESEQIAGLYLNILYRCEDDNESVTGTTGTSLKIFTPDRSLEQTWDSMVETLLLREDIPFE